MFRFILYAVLICSITSTSSSKCYAQSKDNAGSLSEAQVGRETSEMLANAEAEMKTAFDMALRMFLPDENDSKTVTGPDRVRQMEWQSGCFAI